jgi:transcriptional regulator with PAS, ATPase and Fis domain
MLQLLATAERIAKTSITVVVTGQSGTGKELLARYVHHHSERRKSPFIAVNCGALHEDLLASELFGHEKGAFTGANKAKQGLFQSANGGTLLLDEVGEMSEQMQIKLLRVIQEREVQPVGSTKTIPIDVRIIAATHRDLQAQVKAKQFRQDLYYRLNVIELNLPPLNQRLGDAPLLAQYFLKQHTQQMQHTVDLITPKAMSALTRYQYPGNIRELSNIIERGVALSTSNTLTEHTLPDHIHQHSAGKQPSAQLQTLAEREQEYIGFVLEKCNNNKKKAAEILGIDRVSLWRKLKTDNYLTRIK